MSRWIVIFALFYATLSQASFPCDLSQIKDLRCGGQLPELYLSGEDHTDFYCAVDEGIHFHLGKTGELLFAKEAEIFGDIKEDAPWMRGIEEPTTYSVGTVVFVLHNLLTPVGNTYKVRYFAFSRLFPTIAKLKVLNDTWHFYATQNPDLPEGDKELAEKLNIYMSTSHSTKESEHFYQELETQFGPNSLWKFMFKLSMLFLHVYNDSLLPQLKKQHPEFSLREIDTNRLKDESYVLDDVLLNLRNDFMAQNIAHLYCEAAYANKPLFVVLGSAHVKGLMPILEKMAKGSFAIFARDSKASCTELLGSSSPEHTQQALAKHFGSCVREKNQTRILELAEAFAKREGQPIPRPSLKTCNFACQKSPEPKNESGWSKPWNSFRNLMGWNKCSVKCDD